MTPEAKVKDGCKAIFKARKIWYYMPAQNGMGVVGIPDFICCWRGLFLAVETKAPGKLANTTPNQKRRIAEINEHGGMAIVVDDPRQLAEFLDSIKDDQSPARLGVVVP